MSPLSGTLNEKLQEILNTTIVNEAFVQNTGQRHSP